MNEDFNFKWSIIQFEVLNNTKISDNAKIVYSYISALANNKCGYCYASNNYLSKITNKSNRTIQRALQQLKQSGFIQVDIEKEYQRKIYIVEDMIMNKIKENKSKYKELFDYDWLNDEKK